MNRFRPYAQLLRLPNVFTALADIGLAGLASGALTASAPGQTWLTFALLLFASGCLYCAGMVWNDIFDLAQDQQERPFRPLPSGRITRARAVGLGSGLILAGLALAGLAGWRPEGYQLLPLVTAGILVVAILMYDGFLKRTWAGPLGMGACRFLNVLLGLTLAPGNFGPWAWDLAAAVGVYIVGVTWFARTEARDSDRDALTAAAVVMLAGLLLGLALPTLAARRALPFATSPAFPYLLVVFGFVVGLPVCRAIHEPSPKRVQGAVKTAVLGLVALDAILATALAGLTGLVLLVLLPPALYLGRWIYST